jgi:hypothetical protein
MVEANEYVAKNRCRTEACHNRKYPGKDRCLSCYYSQSKKDKENGNLDVVSFGD